MPKIRKLKRRKKFRANVNRKRLRNKLKKLPNIECKEIKEAWEGKRSTVKNLSDMGLAYNPNQVLKIPKVKFEILQSCKSDYYIKDSEKVENIIKKAHVIRSLEEEANCPRERLFRLPNNEVQFATYMMDKYSDDYMAMVRDKKNYNQLTWRQIKAKIERFKSVPEQFAEYLVQKGEIILENPSPIKRIKPILSCEPLKNQINSKSSRRKRKKSKLIDSIWQEESILDHELLNNDDNNVTVNMSKHNVMGSEIQETSKNEKTNTDKKLQLFSDNENEFSNDSDYDNNDVFSKSENETQKERNSKLRSNKLIILRKNKMFNK